MSQQIMTSLQRVLTTLGHQEPDRVPFFLLVTMHGAKELGMSIKEYFSKAENIVEGQLRLRAKYRHDCIYPFFYAAVETEARGAEVLYRDNGAPNSGAPVIEKPEDIIGLDLMDIEAPCMKKVLRAIEMLKIRVGDEAPIIGVVMSPFSVPIMQMGFEQYLILMYEHPKLFEQLMRVNEDSCVAWANAQLQAGATVICYFDPMSSLTITPRDLYLRTGYKIAQRTIARINGPTATHLASGRCLPIVDDIAGTGTAAVGTSVLEDLADLKAACKDKLTVLGNLNGIEMCDRNPEKAKSVVKESLAKAAQGGGFILSDSHGEIPWQVSDGTLMAISDAVHNWGRYPINIEELQFGSDA